MNFLLGPNLLLLVYFPISQTRLSEYEEIKMEIGKQAHERLHTIKNEVNFCLYILVWSLPTFPLQDILS